MPAWELLNKQIEYRNVLYPKQFVVEKVVVMDGRTHRSWREQLSRNANIRCNNCKFRGADLQTMADHYHSCSRLKRFACKACKYRGDTAGKVADHAAVKHLQLVPGDDSGGSGSEADVGAESSDSEGSSGVDENQESEAGGDDDDIDDVLPPGKEAGRGSKRTAKGSTQPAKKRIREHRKPEQLADLILPDRKCELNFDICSLVMWLLIY